MRLVNRVNPLVVYLFAIPLLATFPTGGAADAQTGSRVAFGINPTVFRAGQPATAELSVCSVSSPVPLTLSPGNSFLFIVDGSIGTVLGFTTPISVTSASLSPVDFSVSFGGNQINITYNGAAKPFAYGDCLGLKVTLQASPQVGSGKLSLSSQFVSSINGNLPFTIVSVLDFANTGCRRLRTTRR